MSKRKTTTLGVVHVTATKLVYALTSKSLKAMHKARGFRTTGYHEWIDRAGESHITDRGVDEIGAHVKGYNSISYGIALEGGYSSFDITDAQMATLERRMRELSAEYPSIKWCGHRDLSPDGDGDGMIEPHEHTKACPQFDVIPWAHAKGLPVAPIRGLWTLTGSKPGTLTPLPHKSKAPTPPDARNMYLQRLLHILEYPVGVIDGDVGPTTKKAIGLFQLDKGLAVTEEFDVATVKKLRWLVEERGQGGVTVAAVPKQLEKPLTKSTSFAQQASTAGMALAGMGGGALFNDWRIVAVAAVSIVALAVLGILLHKKLILTATALKQAVEA